MSDEIQVEEVETAQLNADWASEVWEYTEEIIAPEVAETLEDVGIVEEVSE